MPKTTDLECDWCGCLWVGANNPYEFWRQVCPKRGNCTAKIVSRYTPDPSPQAATLEASPALPSFGAVT
jgi:hypothetical protein